MGMSSEDRHYFDSNFKEVHKRITDSNVDLTKQISDVSTELRVYKATPCKDVADHVARKHDPAKQVGIIASVCAIAGAIGGFLMWLIKFGGKNGGAS